ncbi:MAG TPA: hypothetical protein EYQ00_05150 [Dehalococcoidia bacterium]|jgi:hypothetical protein|nr:hypothetical protein [Dehalococcoidia bacterium]
MSNVAKYANLALAFCLLGVVDQIYGRSVAVELTNQDRVTEHTALPLWMFPCEVKEGDVFYFTKTDEVLELRCGEPPKLEHR